MESPDLAVSEYKINYGHLRCILMSDITGKH